MAGLIDGEGCLTITKYQGKNNITPVFCAQVLIAMTSKEAIEYARTTTGAGRVYNQEKRGNSCAQYRWAVNNTADVLAILVAITPYLVVKAEEARTLMEYLCLPKAPDIGRGHSMPPVYVKQREAYYQRLRDLKTKGKAIGLDDPKPEAKKIASPQTTLF